MTYQSGYLGTDIDEGAEVADILKTPATTGYVLKRTGPNPEDFNWQPDTGVGGDGNLRSDGSVPMDAGYVPNLAQDIATKNYSDSKSSLWLTGPGPILFGLNSQEVARINATVGMGIHTQDVRAPLHVAAKDAPGAPILPPAGGYTMVVEGNTNATLALMGQDFCDLRFDTGVSPGGNLGLIRCDTANTEMMFQHFTSFLFKEVSDELFKIQPTRIDAYKPFYGTSIELSGSFDVSTVIANVGNITTVNAETVEISHATKTLLGMNVGSDSLDMTFDGTELQFVSDDGQIKFRQNPSGQMIIGNNTAAVTSFVAGLHVYDNVSTNVTGMFGNPGNSRSVYIAGNSINADYGAPSEADLAINQFGYLNGQTIPRNLRIYDGQGVELVKVDAIDQRLEVEKIAPLSSQVVHAGTHVIGDLTFVPNAGEVTLFHMPIDTNTPDLPMDMLITIGSKTVVGILSHTDGAGDVSVDGLGVIKALGVFTPESTFEDLDGIVIGESSTGEYGIIFAAPDNEASIFTAYDGYVDINSFHVHKTMEVPTYFPTEKGSVGARLITDGEGALTWEQVSTGVDVTGTDATDKSLTTTPQSIVTVSISPIDANNPNISWHFYVENPTNQDRVIYQDLYIAGVQYGTSYVNVIPRGSTIDVVRSVSYTGTIANGAAVHVEASDDANNLTVLGTVSASTIRVYDVSTAALGEVEEVHTQNGDHTIEFVDVLPYGPGSSDRQIHLRIDGVDTYIRCYD